MHSNSPLLFASLEKRVEERDEKRRGQGNGIDFHYQASRPNCFSLFQMACQHAIQAALVHVVQSNLSLMTSSTSFPYIRQSTILYFIRRSISDAASGLRSRHGHSSVANDIVEDVTKPQELLEPTFGHTNPVNITVQEGGTAYLTCIVHNLGNKTVVLIRSCLFR